MELPGKITLLMCLILCLLVIQLPLVLLLLRILWTIMVEVEDGAEVLARVVLMASLPRCVVTFWQMCMSWLDASRRLMITCVAFRLPLVCPFHLAPKMFLFTNPLDTLNSGTSIIMVSPSQLLKMMKTMVFGDRFSLFHLLHAHINCRPPRLLYLLLVILL